MPKLFPIGIEVEEIAVGRVLRALDSMAGVVKINLSLGGKHGGIEGEEEAELASDLHALPRLPRLKRSPRDDRGRADQAIAEALKDSHLHVKLVGNILKRRGFSLGSVAATLYRMRLDGHVKGLGNGVWQLTAAGRRHFLSDQAKDLSPPKSNERKSPPKNGGVQYHRPAKNGTGVRGLVLRSLKTKGPMSTREVTKILTDNGLSDKNMSGTVFKMRKEGLVDLRDGVYSVSPAGLSEVNELQPEPSTHPTAAE